MDDPKPNWFRAKRYGWGWTPVTWQGWVVLAAWLGILIPTILWLRRINPILFILFVAAMFAVLIAICYLKGEPPRWRWGRGS